MSDGIIAGALIIVVAVSSIFIKKFFEGDDEFHSKELSNNPHEDLKGSAGKQGNEKTS